MPTRPQHAYEVSLSKKWRLPIVSFFFFNDTATTEIYTLSLHDALPIYVQLEDQQVVRPSHGLGHDVAVPAGGQDRKSTRLNSSHSQISYAVFCLKKKKIKYLHLRYGTLTYYRCSDFDLPSHPRRNVATE